MVLWLSLNCVVALLFLNGGGYIKFLRVVPQFLGHFLNVWEVVCLIIYLIVCNGVSCELVDAIDEE
jgi:hypothetical protein